MNAEPAFPLHLAWHERLHEAGDEAVLPAGSRLADEQRAGRHCFLLMEGSAAVQAAGEHLASLTPGAFVGSTDPAGLPAPPAGMTVRLVTAARVLVLDTDRLAALIDADPAIATIWRRMVDGGRSQQTGSEP